MTLPLFMGLGVYFILVAVFTNSHVMGLGFGVGVGIVVWYMAETHYLRRQEKGK